MIKSAYANGSTFVHTRTFAPGFIQPFGTERIGLHLEAAGAQGSYFSKEGVSCQTDPAVAPKLDIRCR